MPAILTTQHGWRDSRNSCHCIVLPKLTCGKSTFCACTRASMHLQLSATTVYEMTYIRIEICSHVRSRMHQFVCVCIWWCAPTDIVGSVCARARIPCVSAFSQRTPRSMNLGLEYKCVCEYRCTRVHTYSTRWTYLHTHMCNLCVRVHMHHAVTQRTCQTMLPRWCGQSRSLRFKCTYRH